MDIYEKLARCGSAGEVKRMLRGNGMAVTADMIDAPKDFDDTENDSKSFLVVLDGKVYRMKIWGEVQFIVICDENDIMTFPIRL